MGVLPKISVIIPNYNHALYLEARISSVLNQTEKNIEVLILDDCSTDNSRDIINEYALKDSRIRTIYNSQNSGSTFKQWNKGFSLVSGKYIWIAESDDYADIHFLEKLLIPLEEDNGIGLSYCDSWHVYEEQNKIERNFSLYTELDKNLWKSDFTIEGIDLVKKYMSYRNIIPNASAVLIRREVIERIPPADETKKLVGDWIFWASILALYKISFVSEPMNYYRHHNKNVRSATLLSGVQFIEITQMLLVMKSYGMPDQYFFKKMILSFLDHWFYGMIQYNISLSSHLTIIKNIQHVENRNIGFVIVRFFKFLAKNKFSNLRQLIGDKGIYKIFPFLKNNKITNN